MDVYVYALKVQYSNQTYMKVKVEWWAHGKNLGIKQTIKIQIKDRHSWLPCDDQGKGANERANHPNIP